MLSEEEKKAIERLEEQLNFWKKQNIKNSDCEIILSFITKLQKENEKYKYLYQKALDNTVSSDRENIQLKEQIDLMAEYINHLSDELVQTTGRNELEFCNGNKCCKDSEYSCEQCIKQYYERKSKE